LDKLLEVQIFMSRKKKITQSTRQSSSYLL